MYKIEYSFVRVGLQHLFYKVSSKIHGLPCRSLAASIRGCVMKNSPRKPRSSWIKKVVQHTPSLLGRSYNFCLIKLSLKARFCQEKFSGLRRSAWGQMFFKLTEKPLPGRELQLFQISLKLVNGLDF